MCYRSSQFDMSHTFTADTGFCDLNAAAIAYNALITDLLVFSAGTFPVLLGTEDTLAEQTVTFRLLGTVIDRLRLLYFTIRPFTNSFRRGESDFNCVKVIDIHRLYLLSTDPYHRSHQIRQLLPRESLLQGCQ